MNRPELSYLLLSTDLQKQHPAFFATVLLFPPELTAICGLRSKRCSVASCRHQDGDMDEGSAGWMTATQQVPTVCCEDPSSQSSGSGETGYHQNHNDHHSDRRQRQGPAFRLAFLETKSHVSSICEGGSRPLPNTSLLFNPCWSN